MRGGGIYRDGGRIDRTRNHSAWASGGERGVAFPIIGADLTVMLLLRIGARRAGRIRLPRTQERSLDAVAEGNHAQAQEPAPSSGKQ